MDREMDRVILLRQYFVLFLSQPDPASLNPDGAITREMRLEKPDNHGRGIGHDCSRQ
jgi:hypothetical protein